MTSDKLDEKAIFNFARRIESPNARAEYLQQACGQDRDLIERVATLLSAYHEQASFLESPLGDRASIADGPAIAEQPGDAIGPYALREQIGEGGFGVVFLAEQDRPVRRKVALKVIKPGMDTREVIGRFEAERQALAMMDHPNIAKVHDAGATEHGRPYFVMELVPGVPITEYCDQCNLPTRERLDLFVTVCQAVQHAHQKGVIHRDLKPTNVLVAMQDGRPAPKIIDFGVAKAIDQRLTEHTLTTAFAQMVGTPLYMSPEQAELSPLGVDTRSDIYSLGVMLYELLTGATPFDKDRLHEASYDELRRIIREEEPPRPSARISTLAADLATTVSERRRTDARRLQQTVRGELDWIVMKCLEKDRNRRYETPNSLARDIERYLHDEPVQACPPSVGYRLRKFVRRNKAVAAIAALVAGVVVFLAYSYVAIKYERDAKATAFARAGAVSNFLQEMLSSARPDRGNGSQYTVRELLDDSSAAMSDQFSGQPEVESDIHKTIARTYSSLNLPNDAQPHFEKAIELQQQAYGPEHVEVAELLVSSAWVLEKQGRRFEAEAQVNKALDIYRQRGISGAPVLLALTTLQQILMDSHRDEEAERVLSEAIAVARRSGAESSGIAVMLGRQATIKMRQGLLAESEQLARQVVDMQRNRIGEQPLKYANALVTLSHALQSQQKHEAEQAIREALEIFQRHFSPDHPTYIHANNLLKEILTSRDDQAALDALAKTEAETATRADSPENHVRLAGLLLANRPPTNSQIEEARRLIRWAIDEFSQAAVDYPNDIDRRVKSLGGYVQAIEPMAAAPGSEGEVDELNRRLEAELPKVLTAFPDSGDSQWQIANLYRAWAVQLLPYRSYLSTAERALRESTRIHEQLSLAEPKRPGVWLYLADKYILLGYLRWRSDGPDDAEADYRRAMEIYDQHEAEEIAAATSGQVPLVIAIDSVWLADFLACTGREDEAEEFIRKAALNAKRLTDPVELAGAHYLVALIQARVGDEAGYRQTCKALIDVPVLDADDFTKVRTILTSCHLSFALEDRSLPVKRAEELASNNSIEQRHVVPYVLGAALYRNAQYKRAAEALEESIARYPTDPPPYDRIINWQRLFLAMTKWQLGQREEARRLLAEIQPAIDEELQSPVTPMNYRLTLEVLRRDADTLIGQDQPEDAPNNDSPKTND